MGGRWVEGFDGRKGDALDGKIAFRWKGIEKRRVADTKSNRTLSFKLRE